MAQAVDQLAILPGGSFLRNARPTTWVEGKLIAAAATAEYINVPTGAKKVVFGATGNFCVRLNATQAGTAAATAVDTTDGTGCEVNPAGYYLFGVTEISVKAFADNTYVTATFYL
jgi:hypothetical protein